MEKLIECGHIYVKRQKSIKYYVINCLFCKKEYCKWSEYFNHLQIKHLQLELETDEEEEEENVHEYNTQKELSTNHDQEPIQDNNEINSDFLAIEFLGANLNEDTVKDEKDEHSNNDQQPEEYLMEYVDECVDNSVDLNNDDLKSNVDEQVEIQRTSNTLHHKNQCFFRMRTTDSNIMLKFIELLRQHPCQWNHKHPDFTNKEKRLQSSTQLSQELRDHLGINVNARGTRSSIVTLIKWFDENYIRLLRCEEKDYQFICVQSEYFEKLLEYLPYTHLRPMTCGECFKYFKSEQLLLAHKHRHHNGQIPFKCRYCGRAFLYQSSHKMHENRHIKIQLWPCKICQYKAATKADYIKHLATHSPDQPYKCDICGLAYKTTTNLNVHKKSHSLPKYECEICKKKFYEKYRYKRHIWLHEKEEKSWTSVDNFTCQICGRRFTSNKTLMKHKLVHIQENYNLSNVTTSEQNFEKDVIVVYYCGYCSLEFINREVYNTHMNLKHNTNF